MFPFKMTRFKFSISPIYAIQISFFLSAVYAAPPVQVRDSDATHLTDEDFARGLAMTEDELKPISNYQKPWIQSSRKGADYSGKAEDMKGRGENRNGVRLDYDKWSGGQIPYIISNRYNQRERAIIARSMQAYHDKTCINFVPRQNERDYLYIGKIDGCFSDVGRAGGRQELSLADGCVEYDTAIHELMHAVGFWHEHERWDRGNYIDIIWDNIERQAYDQFGKVNLFESDYYNETYDYFSIMHYDSKSFSKNGLNTIEARSPGMTRVIGKVKDFSDVDLKKINKMYRCPERSQPSISNSIDPSPNTWNGNSVSNTANGNQQACVDGATLCWRWIDRCQSPFFADVMREFCARTCNYCSDSQPQQSPTFNQQTSFINFG